MTATLKTTSWPIIGRRVDIASIKAVAKGLVKPRHAAYCVSIKQSVNPGSMPARVLNAAAGPNIIMPLLTLNGTEYICVDRKRVNAGLLIRSLQRHSQPWGPATRNILDAVSFRFRNNYWHTEHFFKFGAELIAFELMTMGVKMKDVWVSVKQNGEVDVKFPWAYPGEKPKERLFRYFCENITRPDWYKPSLKDIISKGFDYFYQRCAVECMDYTERYLPWIANYARTAVVLTPAQSKGLYLHTTFRLMKALGQDFYHDGRVNSRYERIFAGEFPGRHYIHLYRWMLEIWRRKA